MMMRRLLLLLLLAAGPALAQDAEADALSLADRAEAKAEQARDWQLFVEGMAGRSDLRGGGAALHMQRLSLGLDLDKPLAPGWRALLSDRLDLSWQGTLSDRNSVNSLKEAYLSWQPRDDRILDVGRINVRNGVATGYNPTDFLRDGANRSIVSIDPVSLKKNRLGSAMLRGQALWEGGSFTALYAPKLENAPDDAPFSPDFGATNNRERWLLALGQQLSEGVNPQWLLYREQGRAPQLGFNLALLANDATVAYVEWAGGRSPSQWAQATHGAGDTAFRNRVAAGLTYTTSSKLSLTLELDHDGAALDRAAWDALPRQSPAAYGLYRRWVQNAQELPTRRALFLYASWQDAGISHLDLNGMLRFNAADHSRLSWLEARYHWERTDLALQWQWNGGRAGSEFGALPQQRVIQLLLRQFF